GEEIIELTRPESRSILNSEKLRCHANLLIIALYASIQNRLDSKLAAREQRVFAAIGVFQHRAGRAYDNLLKIAQASDQGVGHPEPERLVRVGCCKRLERQHGDRSSAGTRSVGVRLTPQQQVSDNQEYHHDERT